MVVLKENNTIYLACRDQWKLMKFPQAKMSNFVETQATTISDFEALDTHMLYIYTILKVTLQEISDIFEVFLLNGFKKSHF